jgi:hypothetical protein
VVVPARARVALAAAVLIVLGSSAAALAAEPTAPVFDDRGRLVETPFAPSDRAPELTQAGAVALLRAHPKVAAWLDRYPPKPTVDAEFDPRERRWEIHVWSGRAGEVATGVVDDAGGRVLEAWTGPQVAWKMARGRPGAFGGRTLTSWPVWVALSAVFFLVLADLRRPVALRNLDVVALLGFGVSLVFFNRGDVFTSVPLAYVPLVYLLARMAWVGFARRPLAAARPVWPTWLLVGLSVFLLGLRIGLNAELPRGVIDVGYAGVIGADRILDGRAPYGHMPVEEARTPCGPPDASGEIRERIQDNGRCEAANPRGDTYGPVAYLVYVPAVAAIGWGGRWDALPAAHVTSIALDLLCVIGLALVGRRFGGRRLAAIAVSAWVAYPFTTYALLANTNDAIMPAALVWGFWLVSSPWARGAALAAAGWAKFAALLLAPLWLAYPGMPRLRSVAAGLAAFAGVTVAAFSILLLEPGLADAARTFWERTVGFQLDRESPFSLWGWGQYHAAGIPDLAWLRTVLQVGVLALALAAAVWPRTKGPLELAALTAAVLLAAQLVLPHWFYLYLPWVLPFAVLALLLDREAPDVGVRER